MLIFIEIREWLQKSTSLAGKLASITFIQKLIKQHPVVAATPTNVPSALYDKLPCRQLN